MQYPSAPVSDVVDDFFGTPVPDPYRPLEEPRSEETLAWLDAQDALCAEFFEACDRGPWRALVQRLAQVERVGIIAAGGPVVAWLLSGNQREQAVLMVKVGNQAPVELFDPAIEDPHNSIAAVSVSPNGRYVAYGVSLAGADLQDWRLFDVEKQRYVPMPLGQLKLMYPAWLPDESGFLYGRWPLQDNPLEGENAGHRLCHFDLATQQSRTLYFDPAHPERVYHGSVLQDGDTIGVTIRASSSGETALFLMSLSSGEILRWIHRDFDAKRWVVGKWENTFLVLTDDGAPKNKILRLHTDGSTETLVPEGEDTLQGLHQAGDWIVVNRLHHATARLERIRLSDGFSAPIDIGDSVSVGGIGGPREQPFCLVAIDAFDCIPEVRRVDLDTGSVEPWFGCKLDVDIDEVVVQKIQCPSKDGTMVPGFMVYTGELDAPRKTVLYGYGGFDVPVTPRFASGPLSWVLQGGVYVMANLRGGGEYGEDWHRGGMRANKQNVFDDCHGVARWLIDQGVTTTSRLAVQGRSNGGLLAAACLVQEPTLYGAALPGVGVLDMLRYHLFTVGRLWAREYGTSEEDDMFPVIYRYSPLHNIVEGKAYPPTLVTTGDHDDRVVPAHSYKFAARLQAAQGASAPILLRVDRSAGHGAGKKLSAAIEQIVDEWAFLEHVLE